MTEYRYGFRILGPCTGERQLTVAAAALSGYAECTEKAQVNREAYLSAFQFPEAFADHLRRTNSTKGYNGPCGAAWLWWDIDSPADLENATEGARRLAVGLVDRYSLDDDLLLIFFSGSKGFHVGLPAALWAPEPGPDFHRQARAFCERLATDAGVTVDSGVYDKVRAFRAPNSRHPKTGLFKRRFTLDALLQLSTAAILELAKAPEPFDLPEPGAGAFNFGLASDWQEACKAAGLQAAAMTERTREALDNPKLNRLTLDFIRHGADTGDRHRLLFSAASNLAEFGCPPALAHALLEEGALDSGLAPAEVHRQIECGLKGGTV